MNRGQLRQKLILRLRIPPAGDPLLDEPTLNECIAQALRDISSVSDWPWLLTSSSLTFTAGVAPAPATMVKVRELTITSVRAKFVGLAEFLDIVGTGDQWVWTVIGTNVQLTPAPTTSPTNVLYFIRAEPDLTVDTQSPLIPEAHQQAVLSRASYHACVRKGLADAAQFHQTEYGEDLNRMRDATKVRTGPRQVREAGGRWQATW